ncbi:MAG: hypothetical protein N2747_09760 [Chitinophagaceae bacterium]|nr:hypothetical protein [Chitinophagaceae bacterium]
MKLSGSRFLLLLILKFKVSQAKVKSANEKYKRLFFSEVTHKNYLFEFSGLSSSCSLIGISPLPYGVPPFACGAGPKALQAAQPFSHNHAVHLSFVII